MKRCTKCSETKELARFKPCKRIKSGYGSWCYDCINADRKSKLTHYRKVERTRELRNHYGITLKDYEQMRIEADFKCTICGKPEVESYRKKLFIDHDHKTGKVRSLLCDKCNVGLGSFQDSPELLETALQYLIRHRS